MTRNKCQRTTEYAQTEGYQTDGGTDDRKSNTLDHRSRMRIFGILKILENYEFLRI